jgi:hypothetical protein
MSVTKTWVCNLKIAMENISVTDLPSEKANRFNKGNKG